MKKPSPDYKRRQNIIICKRLKRTKRECRCGRESQFDYETIQAPRIINLTSAHEETCVFIERIRLLAREGKPIKLDFSRVHKVYSCGTLLLLAEIDRLKRGMKPRPKMTSNYPANLLVEKAFQHVGILKLLGKKSRKSVTKLDISVYNWRHASGTAVDLTVGDELFKNIRTQVPSGYRKIIRGIEEAVTNTVHHAYIDARNDGLDDLIKPDPRWWVFSEILDGWLHIVICDLGVGIPRTVPIKWREQVIDILTDKNRNMVMVERAFQFGRTRTKKSNRGKGLSDIKATAEKLEGKFMLITEDVVLSYDFTKQARANPRRLWYNSSIMGTVIQWSIPLKQAASG